MCHYYSLACTFVLVFVYLSKPYRAIDSQQPNSLVITFIWRLYDCTLNSLDYFWYLDIKDQASHNIFKKSLWISNCHLIGYGLVMLDTGGDQNKIWTWLEIRQKFLVRTLLSGQQRCPPRKDPYLCTEACLCCGRRCWPGFLNPRYKTPIICESVGTDIYP